MGEEGNLGDPRPGRAACDEAKHVEVGHVRDEIEILRLVGAPEFLIRGPYLLGGLVQGVLGALVALALLWVATRMVLAWVAAMKNALLGVFAVRFLPASACVLLLTFGLAAGLLGGLLAVRCGNLAG